MAHETDSMLIQFFLRKDSLAVKLLILFPFPCTTKQLKIPFCDCDKDIILCSVQIVILKTHSKISDGNSSPFH